MSGKPDYKFGVKIDEKTSYSADVSKYADAVQDVGNDKQHGGCWECGADIADAKAAWVGDHIHSFALHKKGVLGKIAEVAKGAGKKASKKFADLAAWEANMYIFPSCQDCSRTQASIVKKLKRRNADVEGILTKLKPVEWKLVLGGSKKWAKGPVSSASTTGAKKLWDGQALKCHACGQDSSNSSETRYIADHYPPKEFNTHYAREVFKLAGISLVDPELRPHCPACSGKQGGGLKKKAAELEEIAKNAGIKVY